MRIEYCKVERIKKPWGGMQSEAETERPRVSDEDKRNMQKVQSDG